MKLTLVTALILSVIGNLTLTVLLSTYRSQTEMLVAQIAGDAATNAITLPREQLINAQQQRLDEIAEVVFTNGDIYALIRR